MPELPEVEVLVRHLEPCLRGRVIRSARVSRPRVVAPASRRRFQESLRGAAFAGLTRRGKYLVFSLRPADPARPSVLIGHLGMTGRMYLLPADAPPPKHAAAVLDLGAENFVFEDTRYFGRLTLDAGVLRHLGPEPLGSEFTIRGFAAALRRSSQAIKVKLLDQSLVAGVGNIYASEALFRAGVAPTLPARRLAARQVEDLWRAVREVLAEAIERGSTVPLSFAGADGRDGFFYFGGAPGTTGFYEERLCVYDKAGRPCRRCGARIKRRVQAARSTFYCPRCQRR
jgi:formamidopyrimidine-DNA glycosylase